MDFETLHEMIPYVHSGKKHLLSFQPYNGITLRMPGRHAGDTDPIGGDFVVCVDDADLGWISHQFTHDDLFSDIEEKTAKAKYVANGLMRAYAEVVFGRDPEDFEFRMIKAWEGTLHPQTFLYAVQCLAVAEHRRYHQHESRGGGRFLPARFASGIVEGVWTAADAKAVQRRGRLGLDQLLKEKGKPSTLKELAT